MAKSSGGVRGRGSSAPAPRIVGFKESEKAVQLELQSESSILIQTPHIYREKNLTNTTKVWIPRSQIENGTLSEWIAEQKRNEVLENQTMWFYTRFRNSRITPIDFKGKFIDATGRTVDVRPTAREQQYKAERAKRSQAALESAKQTRAALVAKAKANGYKAHDRMKTRTLELMAEGKYQSKAERRAQQIETRRAILADIRNNNNRN